MSSAFEFIQENPEQLDVLKNKYVTFSEDLINFINKKNKVKGDGSADITNFFYSDILEKQKEINFNEKKPSLSLATPASEPGAKAIRLP